ncbi:MAG: TonB-dependent receptor [Chitinophagaceae bacterium]
MYPIKIICLVWLCSFFVSTLYAQQKNVSGIVTDSTSNSPLAGATILLSPGNVIIVTNDDGRFLYPTGVVSISEITVTAVGFALKTIPIQENSGKLTFRMCPRRVELADVVIRATAVNPTKVISDMDIKMRGISNSQEVLRIVPGLFIGQHQGGGKAEQIFLRGFDADHGTDVSISADGIPVNMVSHAHGQGYADSHFIIPETIEKVDFGKGPYEPSKGDFSTAGYLNFHTRSALKDNLLKLEAGQYGTWRGLAMINLLKRTNSSARQSWYAASEYSYSNSYFDNPQRFKRFNLFTKYTGNLSDRNIISVTASTLHSSWLASGQIPERAVEEGLVGFYGALDPNEGGITSRTNVSVELSSHLKNGGQLKNQLYFTHYTFDLHSNFTFFLLDSVNGDEIRQMEKRNLFGYHGSYHHQSQIGATKFVTNIGIDTRVDLTSNTKLEHTLNRFTVLNLSKWGNIGELGAGAYAKTAVKFTGRFTLNAGIRFDQFYYRYNNKLGSDTTLPGIGIYKAGNNIFSPKISLFYQAASNTAIYLSTGKGFHTNDARVVVAARHLKTLPAVYATDLGIIMKPVANLILHAVAWYSYLQQEYVYGGDGGTVEFSGKTRRLGLDVSGRYQLLQSIYIDLDMNYAHGRAIGLEKGKGYIPLAPVLSSTGGITYTNKNGFNGSLRYRYLAKRPANEEYSLTCEGYFVNDLVINYTKPKYEIGIIVNNVFNTTWKETQFDADTRLRHEKNSTEGISFTAGTKFFAKFSVSYLF